LRDGSSALQGPAALQLETDFSGESDCKKMVTTKVPKKRKALKQKNAKKIPKDRKIKLQLCSETPKNKP